jgi:peptidoglycan/xylan/chitin deacetylase (PgdA/CDA1 family)
MARLLRAPISPPEGSRLAQTLAASLVLVALSMLLPMPDAKAQTLPPAADQPCIALTFDDGPDATLTPLLLDILEREHVVATFFVVGQRAAAAPDILRREHAGGNEIGNHTWDHHTLPDLPDGQIVEEIARTDEVIEAQTGVRPAFIRAPYGLITPTVEQALRRQGLMRPLASWDIDTFDWLHGNPAWTEFRASNAAPGAIVLMHDIHAPTIDAVPTIITALKARGLRFTTLSGLAGCHGNGATIAKAHEGLPTIGPRS